MEFVIFSIVTNAILSVYVGISLSVAGISFKQRMFYFIIVPVSGWTMMKDVVAVLLLSGIQ